MMLDFSMETALRLRQADPEETAKTQLALLRDHIRQAGRSPHYRNLLREAQCAPESIVSLKDLASIPFTDRADLDKDAAGFHATPPDSHADLALTSGTSGEPVIVPYTIRDLERLAFNEAMAFRASGIRSKDRVLLTVTLDRCFIAGLAYYSGLVRLGAAAIRSGPGHPARQWELVRQLKPTAVVGVPSFLLEMARWAEEQGLAPRESGVRSLITIGEPVRRPDHTLTPLGKALSAAWGASIFSSYGATELETAFGECQESCGGHVHPELMLVEIVDASGKALPDGEAGEVVVTPLGVEGFPLLRFRTGDVARLHSGPCGCGWQTPRLGPIEGRLSQRLKFRGTTLYPDAIFQALQEFSQVRASYIEIRSAYDLSDDIRVVVGADDHLETDTVTDFLQARLRVRPDITIAPAAEVAATMKQAGGRKMKRFFDYRQNR